MPGSTSKARCVFGGYSFAGQSCISVQRIFVHESVYQQFLDKLVPRGPRSRFWFVKQPGNP